MTLGTLALPHIPRMTVKPLLTPPRYTVAERDEAASTWGFNCGPGAVAAVTGRTIEELRPHLDDFETKHYTNPDLMTRILDSLGVTWTMKCESRPLIAWPTYGLARIQWEGPWTAADQPPSARLRHSHWIGVDTEFTGNPSAPAIFDVNAMSVGGWIDIKTWKYDLVPYLLTVCEPESDGLWHITHTFEVARPSTQ